jgi:hypothetical protein
MATGPANTELPRQVTLAREHRLLERALDVLRADVTHHLMEDGRPEIAYRVHLRGIPASRRRLE